MRLDNSRIFRYNRIKDRNQKFLFFGKKEYGFVVVQKRKVSGAVQVAKVLDRNNEKRELLGLLEAMNKYGLKSGTIITEDQENEKRMEGKIVKMTPLWKWLLEDNRKN
jgi:hypothetical protein